mgnify:CR=1 FL=1
MRVEEHACPACGRMHEPTKQRHPKHEAVRCPICHKQIRYVWGHFRQWHHDWRPIIVDGALWYDILPVQLKGTP